MIKDGDRVAVGLSGGKDSLVLLEALAAFRRFSPERFTLAALTVDMGLSEIDYSGVTAFCRELDVPYEIIKTDIGPVVFDERKEKNPCSLCAKMRRGTLNTAMTKHGYNVLALGHNADDLVETFLLSMFYEGRLSSFSPVSYMSRTDITVIRPLLYIKEKNIAAAARRLPVIDSCCPANKKTQREHIKTMIKSICTEIPIAKDRMLTAILNPERYNLNFDKVKKTDK